MCPKKCPNWYIFWGHPILIWVYIKYAAAMFCSIYLTKVSSNANIMNFYGNIATLVIKLLLRYDTFRWDLYLNSFSKKIIFATLSFCKWKCSSFHWTRENMKIMSLENCRFVLGKPSKKKKIRRKGQCPFLQKFGGTPPPPSRKGHFFWTSKLVLT